MEQVASPNKNRFPQPKSEESLHLRSHRRQVATSSLLNHPFSSRPKVIAYSMVLLTHTWNKEKHIWILVEDAWIEGRDVFIKTAEEVKDATNQSISASIHNSWNSNFSFQRILQYPGVWMRDNCQCPKCFDPSSQQRAILLKDFDPEVSPKDVSLKITNEKVQKSCLISKIAWGHSTT